jgi:hypothetical protein
MHRDIDSPLKQIQFLHPKQEKASTTPQSSRKATQPFLNPIGRTPSPATTTNTTVVTSGPNKGVAAPLPGGEGGWGEQSGALLCRALNANFVR